MYVPEVYSELSSTNVLTMEFINGVKITDTAAIRKLGLDVTSALHTTIRGVASRFSCTVLCTPTRIRRTSWCDRIRRDLRSRKLY
jgi:hypothetical protein